MANYQLSYDYSNTVRDLSDIFATVVQSNPVTSSILTVDNSPFSNTKLEWLDDVTTPLTWTLDAAYTAADGEVSVASTAGLEEGMIVGFEKVTSGITSTLIAKVGTITPGVKFAITVYGGSVDENIANGSTVKLIGSPRTEGGTFSAGAGYEPVAKYNFSQILSRTAFVSRTAFNTWMYGINMNPGDVMNFQVEKALQQLAYEVGSSSILMPRVQRSSGVNGTMGGWLYMLKQESGNTVAWGSAAISSDKLNEAFALIRSNGGMASTIVAHPVHAKSLSSLNVNKMQIMRDDTTAGQYVLNFATNFGDMANIVYSYQMPKDQIAVVDSSSIRLRPLVGSAMQDKDTTLPNIDGIQRTIFGEYSLEVRNAATGHAYITALTF